METKKIFIVVGARPNFMKASPLFQEFRNQLNFNPVLIHTGQHYDNEMSDSFFNELDIPKPDMYLGVGSGTHAEQTAKIMIEFEKICLKNRPDLVIVVGDVNSTIACSLASAKLCIPVAHIEAGLRSFDRTMPEEINRLLTDQLSDFLFTTCENANKNLVKEGIPESKIFFVGNVMIDTLLSHLKRAKKSKIIERLGLIKNNRIKKYALITLHRPSNVDNPLVLKEILNVFIELSEMIRTVFPVHPRTLKQIKKFEFTEIINYVEDFLSRECSESIKNISAIPPLGYLDFLNLMAHATVVLTDSGGIQEETTILGVPCLTLRQNTERPITVEKGTNLVVGNDPDRIKGAIVDIMRNGISNKKRPKYWDGKASKRIVEILIKEI